MNRRHVSLALRKLVPTDRIESLVKPWKIARPSNSPVTHVLSNSLARWGRLQCKATVSHYVQTWPHWISLLNYTSGAKHAARDPVERLCETSPVWTFPLKSQEPNMAPPSKQQHTTNIQCSSRRRNPVSHHLLFCYVLSGKHQTSWVRFKNVTLLQYWFKINNNKRSEPLD